MRSVVLFFRKISRFVFEPHISIQEIGERRLTQLLSVVTFFISLLLSVNLIVSKLISGTLIALYVLTIVSYGLSRSRFPKVGAYLFCLSIASIPFLTLWLGTATSFSATITSIGYIGFIVSSIFLPTRGFIALAISAITATFLAPLYSTVPIAMDSNFTRITGAFSSIGLILSIAKLFSARIERERLSELQENNQHLASLTNKLEERVLQRTAELYKNTQASARRATQLETITELSQIFGHIQNLDEFFETTVKLISERFGFYHVGIFVIDTTRQFAVLQAVSSDAGKRLVERGHRLSLGVGVVGFAAQTGKTRIALDTTIDSLYRPTLSDTRSEVALPLLTGSTTIGVLDVQSSETNAFTEDDLQVLNTLANQVALAFENTRLLAEARSSAEQVQTVYNEFVRSEWSRLSKSSEQTGFRYNVGRIEMLDTALQGDDVTSAMRSGSIVANQPNESNAKRPTVAIPVKLRGQIIGVLQIASTTSNRKWREDELTLMEAVAERAAFALENARLFQEAKRRASKEHLIAEATSRISDSLSIENILQTTVEELGRVLSGSEVSIRFQDKEQM